MPTISPAAISFVFDMGALDQGYWPDGIYTAPTDEALHFAIRLIPLQQIKAILDRNAPGLPDALRMQRIMLEDKRQMLDRAIQAIREAEQSFAAGRRPDAD